MRRGDEVERFEHSAPGLHFEQLAAWPGVAGGVCLGLPSPACRKDEGGCEVGFEAGGEGSQLPRAQAQLCSVHQISEFIF